VAQDQNQQAGKAVKSHGHQVIKARTIKILKAKLT